MTIERLSKIEFCAAIRRGHGRAVLHVQQYGLSEVANIVLESCLKEPSYDRQCESGRASWLLSLFQGAKEYDWFSTEILSALERETEDSDLEHLCDLAAWMAKNGDAAAGKALLSRVLEQSFLPSDTQHGCEALVFLDGVDAVVELAHLYGAHLTEKSDDHWPVLGSLTYELDILAQAERRLEELAATDNAIRAFVSNEKYHASISSNKPNQSDIERDESLRERIRRALPLEKILSDAVAGVGSFPGQYMRFGRYAEKEQLQVIFHRLLTEIDEKTCLRLLWVFRRALLPELHPRIWELTAANNSAIRAAAIEAIAQNCDLRIGEFGRVELRSPNFSENDSEVLDPFIRNYQSQDEVLMLSALRRLTPNNDNAHGLGMSILAICDKNRSPALSQLMRWVYESSPCAHCRHNAVKWMISTGNLTHELVSECLHDANEDIQHLAKLSV